MAVWISDPIPACASPFAGGPLPDPLRLGTPQLCLLLCLSDGSLFCSARMPRKSTTNSETTIPHPWSLRSDVPWLHPPMPSAKLHPSRSERVWRSTRFRPDQVLRNIHSMYHWSQSQDPPSLRLGDPRMPLPASRGSCRVGLTKVRVQNIERGPSSRLPPIHPQSDSH
jgi:hypothetical protein